MIAIEFVQNVMMIARDCLSYEHHYNKLAVEALVIYNGSFLDLCKFM